MNLVFALKSVQKTNLVPYFEPSSSCISEGATPKTLQKQNEWACTQPLKKKIEKNKERGLPLAPPSKNSKNLYLIPPQLSQKEKKRKEKKNILYPPPNRKNTHTHAP